jgi:hypothetical protein
MPSVRYLGQALRGHKQGVRPLEFIHGATAPCRIILLVYMAFTTIKMKLQNRLNPDENMSLKVVTSLIGELITGKCVKARWLLRGHHTNKLRRETL